MERETATKEEKAEIIEKSLVLTEIKEMSNVDWLLFLEQSMKGGDIIQQDTKLVSKHHWLYCLNFLCVKHVPHM